MPDEKEFLEIIQAALGAYVDEATVLRDADYEDLPTDNAASVVTLVDGTKFLVCVTKIEEGA